MLPGGSVAPYASRFAAASTQTLVLGELFRGGGYEFQGHVFIDYADRDT